MTFPNVPLGQLYAHPSLATDTAAGAGNSPMHTLVDGNLNLAAAKLRNMPAKSAELTLGMAAATAQTINSPILWDTVLRDPLGMYAPASGLITAPFDGLYLVNGCWVNNVAAVGTYLTFGPLDPTIYPSNQFMHSRQAGALAHDGSFGIANFPWIAKAGDQVRFGTPGSGATLTPVASSTNGYYCRASVAYLGGIPGALAVPPYINPGASPGLWTPGEPVVDLKLQRRSVDLLNEIQPYLADGAWENGRAIFLASASAVAVAANPSNVLWGSIDYDNTNGYNAATGILTIPQTGLYAVGASMVDAATGTVRYFTLDGRYSDAMRGTLTGAQCGSSLGFVKRYVEGDQIAVSPNSAYTTWATYASYLAVTQLGY